MIVYEETKSFTAEEFDALAAHVKANPLLPRDGVYYLYIPPRNLAVIRMWEAKRKWKEQYRVKRIRRRLGLA